MISDGAANLFGAILLSAVSTLVLSLAGIRLARRTRLMDVPGSAPHKQHAVPTPVAGGLALAAALVLAASWYGLWAGAQVRAILAGGGVILAAALWDDARELPPAFKLIGQALGAGVMISLGVYIQIFESPEFFISGQGPLFRGLDWLLTLLWLVGITNAFNFVDSMDGLAVGLGGTAAAFFMLVTLESGQPALTRLCALLVGACFGLYFFNAPPARMFLGDSGAQTLGFILAGLAIAYTPQNADQASSWFVPIMLLGVPIFDTALVVISRLRRGRPVYTPARDHLYHRLLGRGLESNRAVVAMTLASALLGCLAFVALTLPPVLANSVFGLSLLSGVTGIYYLDRPGKTS